MKKKLLTLLTLITISTSIVACGEKDQNANSNIKSSNETKNTQAEDQESETTPKEETEKTLEDIENYLLDKGILSGERVQMGAELIGGISGFKYKDSVGEIYEYDMESEEYQKLANGEEIPLQGMDGFAVKAISVNGKFVLFGDDVPQELIDAFNSFE